MKKTFIEWLNYSSLQQEQQDLEKCKVISDYYDKKIEYEKVMYEKQRQLNKKYIDRLTK